MPQSPASPAQPQPSPPTPGTPLRWPSTVLLGGKREAQIEHQGAVYTLRLTALGKLILTK